MPADDYLQAYSSLPWRFSALALYCPCKDACLHADAPACAGTASPSSDVSASDMSFQPQAEHFLPYQWRNGQAAAPAPALESPAASESSLTVSDEEEEGLPSSLSGMARHFQNQRAVRLRHRRQNGTAKDVRYY